MLNLSDKELDRLSREAAEQYEPDEEISSWEKLEQQLSRDVEDQPPATPIGFRARPIGYGALLLLLAGASYFLLKTDNNSKSSTLKSKTATEANKESNPDKQNKLSKDNSAEKYPANADNKNESAASNSKTDAASAAPASDGTTTSKNGLAKTNENVDSKNGIAAGSNKTNQHATNPGLNDQKNTSDNKSNNSSKNKINNKTHQLNHNTEILANATAIGATENVNKNNHGKSGNKNKAAQNGAVSAAGLADLNSADPLSTGSNKLSAKNKNNVSANEEAEKPKYAVLPGLSPIDISANGISDSSLVKVAANTADNNSAPQVTKPIHVNRSLKIGLMAGPDVTLVHSTSNSKFSANVGITLGYQFAHKWSVNTGLIYTKKNYASNGSDFKRPPNLSWDYTVAYADGNCSMWEIPLSLRYDFISTTKNNVFINAGLSSYLMKSEDYTLYCYKNSSSYIWPQNYKSNSNSNYFFSVFSLSTGVERQLNKSFSLQVEPFIKIPLKGVGLGNLQLNSYGVSFSLRYAPVLSKSKH